MRSEWTTPNIAGMLSRKNEATTSANVGSFTVPLGGMLRQPIPQGHVPTPPCEGARMCTVEDYFQEWERLGGE